MTGDLLAVSVEEAARLLSWNETGVWGAIKDGRLRSFKLGKRRLISRAALAAFVERRELLDSRPIGPRRESVVPFPALETTAHQSRPRQPPGAPAVREQRDAPPDGNQAGLRRRRRANLCG